MFYTNIVMFDNEGMNYSMLEGIKKKENYKYVAVYTTIIALYHVVMREYYGDTLAYFARVIQQMNFSSLVSELYIRYLTWTSRILVEIPLFILSHGMHMILFGICNVFVHVLLLLALMKLTNYKHNLVLVSLVLFYPVSLMADTGWMTAYITYFWPLSLGVTSMVSLKKLYDGEKISAFELVFFFLCQIYGTNLEVCAVFYTCVLTIFVIMMLWEKKFTVKVIVITVIQYVICAGNIVFALTCPGNEARKLSNIDYWFPSYTSMTFVDKVVVGVNSAVSYLITSDLYWVILGVIILIFTCVMFKDDQKKILVSAFPIAALIVLTFGKVVTQIYYPEMVALFDDYAGRKYVDPTNYISLSVYIPFIVYALTICALFIALMNMFEDVKKSFFTCAVVASGLVSRLTLGFSPTVYASGVRTFIFMDFAMIFVIITIYDTLKEKMHISDRAYTYLRCTLLMAVMFAVLANIIAVCSIYYY